MTILRLETFIKAPIGICFDVSRDIGAHLSSMSHTSERVIAGKSSGLCEAGDTVTWEAIHFGIRQQLSVAITKLHYPVFFEDKMLYGAFRSMRHEHHFEERDAGTIMRDILCYEVPYGLIGMIFNALVLRSHMKGLLLKRNEMIQMLATAKA